MLVSWSLNWTVDLLLHDNHHWRLNPNFIAFMKGNSTENRREEEENENEEEKEKREKREK